MGNIFFKEKVRKLREGKNLTMEQLANAVGVTKSRVNMWENNGTVPRQDALLRLAKFFEVSTDELLGNFNFKDANMKLNSIQRNLKKLNDSDLEKADAAMKLLFGKIWEEDEKEDHGDL